MSNSTEERNARDSAKGLAAPEPTVGGVSIGPKLHQDLTELCEALGKDEKEVITLSLGILLIALDNSGEIRIANEKGATVFRSQRITRKV